LIAQSAADGLVISAVLFPCKRTSLHDIGLVAAASARQKPAQNNTTPSSCWSPFQPAHASPRSQTTSAVCLPGCSSKCSRQKSRQ
jgi:hypothetical protein